MNNRQLIDRLKKAHGLQFDLDLAFIFAAKPPHISAWVNEKRPIPLQLKLRMLQLIDFPHTAEFAAVLVDKVEHARAVNQDLRAIAKLKELEKKTAEALEKDTKDRASSPKPARKK